MNSTILLLRQVNPTWIHQGQVTSLLFKPSKIKKELSVYDGDQIKPENSWRHFTNELKKTSAGVLAVTVNECEDHELCVNPDPTPFPEHVLIQFGKKISNSQTCKIAKYLKILAVKRGWLYQDDQYFS